MVNKSPCCIWRGVSGEARGVGKESGRDKITTEYVQHAVLNWNTNLSIGALINLKAG